MAVATKKLPNRHFRERPLGQPIDTVVIHAMYAKDQVKPLDLETCAQLLASLEVSAHYLISRRGLIAECVEPHLRASHAGVSKMPFPDDQREGLNDFSIGIELLGKWDLGQAYTDSQYRSLTNLLVTLKQQFPIVNLVGHDQVSPGRKQDPGTGFDWQRIMSLTKKVGLIFRTTQAA